MSQEKKGMGVAIIGCGGFVRGNHLPNAHRNPNLHLRALCDLDQPLLERLAGQYHPDYVTTDHRKLAADPEIDLVIIGTTPEVRVELIKAAAEGGKNIYVEKPMSLGYEDSAEIVQIIRRTGVKLQVGFNRPYSPIMQEAKRVFRKMRRQPTLIVYRIVGEDLLRPMHHRTLLSSNAGSNIIHEITHIFNLLNWLTDQDPLTVYTAGDPSDDNIITLTYPDRTYATIVAGNCGTAAYPKERMEVFSDFKALVMNEFVELECTRIPGESDQRFPLASNPGRKVEGITVPELRQDLIAWHENISEAELRDGHYYNSVPRVNKGHYEALQDLYEAIRDDRPVQVDAHAGAVATILGLEALESLKKNQPVKIDYSFLK
ncbi:MAG TPA: Gfo/Idh/MocA family oxidoreductase [bacterium]|nr:Gfo/Idh/MocA family oxidoreductase [bacterium]